MRKIYLALALLAVLWGGFFVSGANAQSLAVVVLPGGCGTGSATNSLSYLTVDSTLKLCVNATVSASITGFPTLQSTGAPIAVTTGGVSGTLPAGVVVVASNVGATNGAFCKLGASASTSDQLIPPNSWFAFTVGAATQLTCITSASTTTVNMVGGSGIPTGSGGGAAGGGGGAVTVADGADVSEGATTDAAATAGSTGSVQAKLRFVTSILNTISSTLTSMAASLVSIVTNTGAAIPAGTNVIGHVIADTGSTTAVTSLPAIPVGTNAIGNLASQYPGGAVPITASATGTTTATTATLAASASIKTYICGFSIRANATGAATNNATVTGTITGTLNYTQWTAPLASGLGVTEQIFTPCIPSSAINTAVAVVSGAPGSGGVVSVTAWGYQL